MKIRVAIGLFLLATATAGLAAPHRAATISVSSNKVTINAPAGGPNPGYTPVTLQTSGGKVDWTAGPGAGDTWLSVTPTSGSLNPNGSVQLKIFVDVLNPNVLAANTYVGHITVNATSSGTPATGSPQVIEVDLVVSSSAVISVSPTSLSYAAPTGVKPTDQTFTLQNAGGSPLNWSASSAQGWIHPSPPSGTGLAPGGTTTITVSLDLQSSPGTYSGSVTIAETGTAQSKAVSVTLVVSSLPQITLGPSTLTFNAPQGGGNPSPQFLTLTNSGGQDLDWSVGITADPPAGWIVITPPTSGVLTSGSGLALPVTINNAPAGTALAAATYNATITVSGTTSGGTPVASQSSQVTLNVNTNPTLAVSPDNAAFTVSVDSAVSAPVGISVQNIGSGTLDWTASGGPGWLTVSPAGGSLAALGSTPMLLSVNASGMAPGLYTGKIDVVGLNHSGPLPYPPASNSPQAVEVRLTVLPSSKPVSAPAGQCGLSGLEGLIPLVALWIRKRISKRGATA
jgi:hypothetical protein